MTGEQEEEYRPRRASEIPEWELEELIRMAIGHLRSDIAERALEWLDQKIGTKH